MNRKAIFSAFLVFAVGCAQSPAKHTSESKAKSIGAPTLAAVAPVADHHKHVWSAAAARVVSAKPRPAIRLPADLDQLLREREQRWNDTAALSELYTDSSIAFDARWPDWWHGRSAVATHLQKTFGRPYALTPTAYEIVGGGGYVTGYYTRGEGEDARHLGYFVISLGKGDDGAWRIAAEVPSFPGPDRMDELPAGKLISQLDSVGIQRAVVLSTAYWFGSPLFPPVENEYAMVRAENDWAAQQVSQYPERLVAFCSFNPLKDYALDELARCAQDLGLRGLKLHLGNSVVDVRDPEHVEKLRAVFRAANAQRLPIVVHLWTDPSFEKEGGEHAQAFLDRVLPEAPDVTIQIAHMAGGGRSTDPALAVFAEAITAGDPRTRNLYFDVATLTSGQSDEGLQRDAMRMRQIGLDRILWGSDGGSAPQLWREFRVLMPLAPEELRVIAGNIAPYLR